MKTGALPKEYNEQRAMETQAASDFIRQRSFFIKMGFWVKLLFVFGCTGFLLGQIPVRLIEWSIHGGDPVFETMVIFGMLLASCATIVIYLKSDNTDYDIECQIRDYKISTGKKTE